MKKHIVEYRTDLQTIVVTVALTKCQQMRTYVGVYFTRITWIRAKGTFRLDTLTVSAWHGLIFPETQLSTAETYDIYQDTLRILSKWAMLDMLWST